jgi:hypothetical protein
MSNNGAPVCPISRPQAVSGQPGLRIPTIPLAVDLPSAIRALNQIQNVLIEIAGAPPIVNNIGFPFGPPPSLRQDGPNQDGNSGSGRVKQDWQEARRCYEIIRVVDPDDDVNNWVDIPILRWLLYQDQNSMLQLEYRLNQ